MKTKYSIIYLRSIGLSILLLLFACFFFSCGEKESGEPQYKVLLLNSYRPGLARTVKSQQLFFDYFEESDVNVDLRVINLEYPNGQLEKQWEEAVETRLDSLGAWKPDLVLLYNDFAVQVTTLKPEWIRAYPVIYGGLTAPDYMLLDLFPNMTGYICPPDYMKNLKFIEEVTGQKEVVVELDYTYTDSLLRNRLMGAEKEFPKDYRIIPVSVGSPARNVSRDAVDAVGNAYLEQMYASAKYYPHLQVMLTPYSNAIMNKTNLPQFTATDVQFADGTARFVGGYFPSLETQVRDIVNYAAKALQGTPLKNLPRMQHQAEYFMDYDAMLRRDLVYDDWSDKATIVNAPFHVVHPMLYYSAFAFGLLLISFATWFVFRLHFLMQHQRKDKVLSSLRQQIERRNQLLKAASCTNWILKGGFISFHEDFANQWSLKLRKISVTDFIGMVHADMQAEFAEFIAKRDKYLNQMAISLSFDEGKTWHMFEINYKTVTKKDGEEMVLGLMINMDMQKQVDDQLLHAQEAAEFVEMKEMFLANMNHDIRTPLSAISGFSELITEMGDELDDETFQSYTQIISQNSQMLLKLVDDVLNMRGNDLGKFCFYPKEVSVDEFMTQAYKTNQVLCPQHLEFKFVKGREGLAFYVDYERTMQVINNFLSNAFKYTQKGSVTLGWQHVAATDEVELYVADTGVGISKEDQIKLFDRFYMTDSNSKKGTGLGLNISKTLVEDQQGRVEVNSVLGAGSRFAAIFKVCRLLLLSLGLGLTSCGELGLQQHPDGRDYKVAVIHSYDTLLEDYQTFEEVLEEEFREEGLSVQQSTFYLDLANVEPKSPKVQQTLESLAGLKPDVVLIDDDLAIQSVLKAGSSYLQEVPIVVGGWTMPDWNYKYHYPLLTGWESPIDYPRNLEMAKEFIDINLVEIELDHTYIDSLRREDLSKGIARPPFVDNSDLHQRELGLVALKEGALKDSIVVMVVSLRTPERNVEKVPHPEYPITDPVAYTNNLMLYSYAYPQLVLKYDSYCNSMFDPYRSPQFTAVRTNFGTSSSLYYGGYFAPTHVVAADMGKYAAAILKGKPVTKLPPAVHQADYWIDYNALMRIAPINEEITLGSLQKRGYHFVNLPFKVLHPVRYYVIPGLIILVIVFVVGYITYCIERRRRDELNRLKKKLEDEIEVGNMVLQNLNGTIFTYRDGCLTIDENFMRFVGLRTNIIPGFEIRKLVHPNYLDDFDVLLDSFWHPGIYQNQLCVRFDEHTDYHWFMLQYVVKTPGEADGFSMMDDKNVLREQKIKNAEKQMQTAMEKNDFLNNISYLVRGPLSSILGFSEIMTTDYSELTPEERKEFSGIISDTSRQLLATVNQVLELSRVESGRAEITLEDTDPRAVLDDVLSRLTFQLEGNDKIKLSYQPGRDGLLIRVNGSRLESALDLIINHSIQTMDKGAVNMGWNYDMNKRKVVFFVEDTGVGMEMKEKEELFKQSGDVNLALAHSIIKHMDGEIEVQSQVGLGTKFSISFDEVTPSLSMA